MSSDSELEEDVVFLATCYLGSKLLNKTQRKPKRFWVRPYYIDRKRVGRFVRDIPQLRQDPELFKETFRVSPEEFDDLLDILKDDLKPISNTRPRDRITEAERLYMTLEYLGSGTLLRHLATFYRCGKTTIQNVVTDTCKTISRVMKPICIPTPTKDDWLNIANAYNAAWNLPNCIGAVDGKHVQIKCPKKAGSIFYNYKNFHSIVLMGIATADYKFLYIDCGAYGSEGDSTVFRDSKFGKAFTEGKLDLPAPAIINGKRIPFFFAVDDAFPLNKNMMKPFPCNKGKTKLTENQNIFNYRLSRGRRCIENTFGILVAKWYCLSRLLSLGPENTQAIVEACCVLHNYLIKKTTYYCAPGFIDSYSNDGKLISGNWRNVLTKTDLEQIVDFDLQAQGRPTSFSAKMRKHLMNFFATPEGSVPWQTMYYRL